MSTSSQVLRKFGLLAAIGTASMGGMFETVSWAQAGAEQAAASESTRASSWGNSPIPTETVLQGIRPSTAVSPAKKVTSPYRAVSEPQAAKPTSGANTPIELGSAYQPVGSSPGGANSPASIGQSAPVQPAEKPSPEETAASEATPAIDLASSYQPQSSEDSEVTPPASDSREEQPAAVRYRMNDTAATQTEADMPPMPKAELTTVPKVDEAPEKLASEEPLESQTPTPEEVAVDDRPVEKSAADSSSEPKPRSILEAMLADNPQEQEATEINKVEHARRVKQRFNLLGIASQKHAATAQCEQPACTENQCSDQECVPTDGEPATMASPALANKSQSPQYPTTTTPQLTDSPAATHESQVSQASHVVPAQWRNAEPRAIQVVQNPANPFADDPQAPGELDSDHFEVIQEEDKALEVQVRRSLLLRTPFDIYRTAVVDSSVCDVVQYTPREVSIIGKSTGSTNVTFWFEDGNHRPVTYVVRVIPDIAEKSQAEVQYRMLEDVLSELFPDSKVRLVLVADKLIVKGQAASAEDAANILAIIRGQSSRNVGNNRSFVSPVQGFATPVLNEAETGRSSQPRVQVVNMLQVPGIQQVALRVKIAQLNRSAARGIGVDADASFNFGGGDDDDALFIQSMLNMASGNAPSVITQFDDANINLGLRYLQQQGVVRLLSEPTLVTLSGRPATFVSGGEFAVPTIVGSAGVNAVTTDFRAFGVIVSFLPTVLDKDRIRLQVAPEFSQINQGLSSGGTFGLNTNAVTTTVEMREGQTLAIAGLLEDTMKNTRVGNIPYLERIFGTRDSTRNENELVILVTPELVHPMEPEEVPPLPGFDVTEPTNKEFYWHGHLEGHPTSGYRSTVWPELRRRYRAGGSTMTSGPFGHGQ